MSKKLLLGDVGQIAVGTSNLDESLAFYHKMGFETVARDVAPLPWAQVSDGTLLLLLTEDGQQYIGLLYHNPEAEKVVAGLEGLGIEMLEKVERNGRLFQAFFASPDGFYISMVNQPASGMHQPGGHHYISLRDEKGEAYLNNPDGYPNPKLGMFGELCHPVEDLEVSLEFWKAVGFAPDNISEKPYPWSIVSNGKHLIGLHQTHEFDQPAITYFAKDMGGKISALRAAGITGIVEFGGTGGNAENVCVNTPEGQRFYLFTY